MKIVLIVKVYVFIIRKYKSQLSIKYQTFDSDLNFCINIT